MGSYSLLRGLRGLAVDFASTGNINYMWNYGSLSGLSISIQVASGLFVSVYVVIHSLYAFNSVEHLMEKIFGSHSLRFYHANICSFVFMIIIVHLSKGLWYSSWTKGVLWKSGTLLLVLTMGSSFLGYVIPWGHMSFWGATVITSLIGVLPYGNDILVQVWGSFNPDTPLLGRLFSLHFLLPLVVMAVISVHLTVLHQYISSSASLGLGEVFTQFYTKDLVTLLELWLAIGVVLSTSAIVFMDADNWFHANPMSTPAHIKPEWYFLFAYCILRCIPNKVAGVISLSGSLVAIMLMAVVVGGAVNGVFSGVFLLLTWLSGAELNDHFIAGSQVASALYFLILI